MKLKDNLDQLFRVFQELKVVEKSKKRVIISGILEVDQIICDEHIQEVYVIQIEIPTAYPNKLPIIKELGLKVDKKYPHRYTDSSLCLATEVDMHVQLAPDYNLVDYVTKFVIPYFVSYEYYKKYETFPFGERSHGTLGILEFYEETFETDGLVEVHSLLAYTANKKYRGHAPCPCGSSERIRKCHGEKIRTLQQEGILAHIQGDFQVLDSILKQVILEEKRQAIEKYLYPTK